MLKQMAKFVFYYGPMPADCTQPPNEKNLAGFMRMPTDWLLESPRTCPGENQANRGPAPDDTGPLA